MADKIELNFEEAMHGVMETKTALERARTSMDQLERLLSERPAAFAPLAELVFRLRDRLIEDLETLQAQLAQVGPAPRVDSESASGEPAEVGRPAGDGPLADRMNLGAQ